MTTEEKVKGQSALVYLYEQVTTNNASMLTSLDRLRDAMDRALGPVPPNETAEAAEPTGNAVIHQTKMALIVQGNLLSTLSKEISRL